MDFIKQAVLQNEHWESGIFTIPRLAGPFVEREVYRELESSGKKKFITVLRGLRRTGKSVLASEFIVKSIRKTKKPKEVAWFEFDRAMNASPDDLDSLIRFFESKGAKTIVLDEVPFVPKWQDVLKRYYDRTNLKFIITGSAALELDRRTAESLAGRFESIHVQPFSLKERMQLKGKAPPPLSALQMAKKSEELEMECHDYLAAGGLPEITINPNASERMKYIKESLLDPLLYKDIPSVFPNANPDLMRKTLDVLAATVSSTYQLQSISQILGCSNTHAGTQVEMLERSLLVRTIFNKTKSVAKQKRTAKKIIFSDNGVISSTAPETPAGKLAENAAAIALQAKFFWRDTAGHEVDLIVPEAKTAVEVKYSEHISTADEKNLRYFLERNPAWHGVLITKKSDEKGDVPYTPLWKVLLNPAFITRRH